MEQRKLRRGKEAGRKSEMWEFSHELSLSLLSCTDLYTSRLVSAVIYRFHMTKSSSDDIDSSTEYLGELPLHLPHCMCSLTV